MSLLETMSWGLVLLVLVALTVVEGGRQQALLAQVPIEPKELYGKLARSSVRLQVVDVRPALVDEYEDAHIPGAIPLPGCDPARAPAGAPERLVPSAPTIVVSADGDPAAFAACRARFGAARNLAGGMAAWSEAALPEDMGEYVPPRPSAGGGCL